MSEDTLRFSECEHSEDLRNIIGDIVICGGIILEEKPLYEDETCEIKVRLPVGFYEKFKETDSCMIMI